MPHKVLHGDAYGALFMSLEDRGSKGLLEPAIMEPVVAVVLLAVVLLFTSWNTKRFRLDTPPLV